MKWVTRNWEVVLALREVLLSLVICVVVLGAYYFFEKEMDLVTPWISLASLVAAPLLGFVEAFFKEKSVLRYIRRVSEGILETAANRAVQHSARYAKEAALSVTFLNQVREQTARARTFLFIAVAGLLILTYAFDFAPMSNAIYVPLGLYLLLLIKDAVLHYRVTHGLFGTNAYEARVMIDFLLENADKTDFTDGGGKLKQAFLPEQLREDHLRGEGDVGVHA